MFRKLFAWINKYERHLSALAMVAGFIVDNVAFRRVDELRTQLVFVAYIVTCVISIAWLHYIESRADRGKARPRWRTLLPLATQFALGGFWSGFLIFYTRSADLWVSWPFLVLLFAIFLGNEILRKYHDRLVFTTVLFFFALYSYAIFAVPVVTKEIGTQTFLESGVVAVVAFAFFTMLLRAIDRRRFLQDVWRIRAGAFVVLVVINLSYFANVLPPLPLALSDAGIYHGVSRAGTVYSGIAEPQSWKVYLGAPEVLHVVSGESLYAFSAVFAPVALKTTIIHQWDWYDETAKQWVTQQSVSFPITGGRDGGYRGYTARANPKAGNWRVVIKTDSGSIIGTISFSVVQVQLPPVETTKMLN